MKGKQKKNFLILLCLFCLGYPFYSWSGTWCLIAFAIFWIIKKGNYPAKNDLQKLHWPFLFYFVCHILGMLWTSNLQDGLDDLQSKSAFLLLPFLLATLNLKREDLLLIFRFFLFGILFTNLVYLGFGGYRYFILQEPSSVFFYSALTTPFKNHPAYTSSYSIFGLVYLINLFFENRNQFKKNRNWNVLGGGFLWLMVILYAGRMQILACLAIVSLVLFWNLIPKRNFFKLSVLTFLFLGGTYLLSISFSVTASRLENATSNLDGPKNIRFQLWESTMAIGKENIGLGVGTGDIHSSLINSYRSKGFERAALKHLNAHNQYLQSFATLGIFGLISFLLLLFIPSLHAIRANNILIISFYLIFALGSLTECMLETQRGSVWLAVFGSLFWGREKL